MRETTGNVPETRTLLVVRYAETDQMGVVHHAHYPVYCEAARTEFFRQHLLPYSEMEARGLWAPVVEFGCRLEGVARYEDRLEITTRPGAFTGARITLEYVIQNLTTGQRVGTGWSLHTFLSPERRLLNIRRFPDLYEQIVEVFGKPERGRPSSPSRTI